MGGRGGWGPLLSVPGGSWAPRSQASQEEPSARPSPVSSGNVEAHVVPDRWPRRRSGSEGSSATLTVSTQDLRMGAWGPGQSSLEAGRVGLCFCLSEAGGAEAPPRSGGVTSALASPRPGRRPGAGVSGNPFSTLGFSAAAHHPCCTRATGDACRLFVQNPWLPWKGHGGRWRWPCPRRWGPWQPGPARRCPGERSLRGWLLPGPPRGLREISTKVFKHLTQDTLRGHTEGHLGPVSLPVWWAGPVGSREAGLGLGLGLRRERALGSRRLVPPLSLEDVWRGGRRRPRPGVHPLPAEALPTGLHLPPPWMWGAVEGAALCPHQQRVQSCA